MRGTDRGIYARCAVLTQRMLRQAKKVEAGGRRRQMKRYPMHVTDIAYRGVGGVSGSMSVVFAYGTDTAYGGYQPMHALCNARLHELGRAVEDKGLLDAEHELLVGGGGGGG
eukprot:1877589-Rhodomonas_salina.1